MRVPAVLTDDRRVRAVRELVFYRPLFSGLIVLLGILVALLEGIGLGFIIPIVEFARSGDGPAQADGLVGAFSTLYRTLGIPFTLEFIVLGVIFVLGVRFGLSFVLGWFREQLRASYERELKVQAFEKALNARVDYFDGQGSDEIINAVITQAKFGARVINRLIVLLEQSMLSLMYISVAFFLAPWLTVGAAVLLGGLTVVVRFGIEPAYEVGDRMAEANESVQEAVQAGSQGIRDVRLFQMTDELYKHFVAAIDRYTESNVSMRRNQAAVNNVYQFLTAVMVFGLVYFALEFTSLNLGALAVFLFAMFRLAPRVSTLNDQFYSLEGDLPHLVRTRRFMGELDENQEPTGGSRTVPETIRTVAFNGVSFSYDDGEPVLENVTFEVTAEEFIAFVGESGGGKSTIVSLLSRLYDPDSGTIRANDIPIEEFDIEEWRSRLSVVRQDPFLFNETLRYNVTVGNRDATADEIARVCEIAQVTEFLNDLPDGYDTVLGDDGIRLSGGQRQRVAIARALLKEGDVLVLDEATSDLDSNIEKNVQSAIEEMERDYAIIAIAHRLSTVKNADCIYTIDGGRVFESGTHEELLDNGGKYADLYNNQIKLISTKN